MNVENHTYNAKHMLDVARDKCDVLDYDNALNILCAAYGQVRELIQDVYALKIEAEQNEPAGTEKKP